MKKRHDLIPSVLTQAKKFMEHESELFSEITKLRTASGNSPLGSRSKFEAESKLVSKLNQLLLNFENYPDLNRNRQLFKQ